MTWTDRLQPEIVLTSPSGREFIALWRGNHRSLEKRVGLFEYPKMVGTGTQDMGSNGVKYPLDIYFEGPDHDIDAAGFLGACKEIGHWTINHPVYGLVILQLLGVTEESNPVESGNVTHVTTEWIEPMDGGMVATVPQIAGEIQDQANVVEGQAMDQFADGDMPSAASLLDVVATIKGTISAVVAGVRGAISSVMSTINGVISSVKGAINGVVGSVMGAVNDVRSIAGQFQALIALPGQMINDIAGQFNFYGQMIDSMIGKPPAIQELICTSCLVGMARAVMNADLTSREEAIAYIGQVQDAFTKVTRMLDAGQSATAGWSLTRQYFSQSHSYNDMALLMAQTANLLLRRSYDLSVARRFTLSRNRAPVEISITEGVDLDLFIASNHLKGDEILLLPAGRQVVVYL
jgi:prophage DNA circulation protein